MLSVDAEVTPAPAVLLVLDILSVVETDVVADEVAVPVIVVVVLARLRMPSKLMP